MWSKALLWKDYRQVKWLVWLFPIVNFAGLGLQRLDSWYFNEDAWIESKLRFISDASGAYENGGLENVVRMLLMILLVLIGGLLTGAERRNGVQEMTFALPYSRQQMYWNKWYFGLGLIAGSLLLNTVIDMVLVAGSPIGQYFSYSYHLFQFVYSCFVLMAVYSTVLFIGAISGSMASQTVFIVILGALPIGFSLLIEQFLDVHNLDRYIYVYTSSNQIGWFSPFRDFMENISLIKYLFLELDRGFEYPIVVPLAYLLISTVAGLVAYRSNRAENNGKLMLFRTGETVLKIGFVVCTSMLGAAFLSQIFHNELVMYYVGLLASMGLSIALIRRLTRVRFKI